jgi:hypothetical protein
LGGSIVEGTQYRIWNLNKETDKNDINTVLMAAEGEEGIPWIGFFV